MKNDDRVVEGEGVVTLFRKTQSEAVVSRVLGARTDSRGARTIWLDRLIHYPDQKDMGGWMCAGAVTTILIEQLPPSNVV